MPRLPGAWEGFVFGAARFIPDLTFATTRIALRQRMRSNSRMPQPLQIGDRVRLTPKYQGKQFHPGDTGTIMDVVPASSPQAEAVYQVRLDTGKSMRFPTFHEAELERV